jgi:hypothetical protein
MRQVYKRLPADFGLIFQGKVLNVCLELTWQEANTIFNS